MAMYAPVKEGGDFEKLTPDTYQAVISNIYDVGIQQVKNSKTGLFEPKQQVIVLFEINETKKAGALAGKRFVQSRTYNFTMSQNSGLRKLCETIVGTMSDTEAAEFDLETLRGVNCTVTIEQNGEYLNLSNIGGLMRGVKEIQPELEETYCPEWIVKKRNNAQAPADTPTQAQNMSNDTTTGLDILDWECKDLVTKGMITEGDRKGTILAVAKKAIDFLFLTEEQANEVVRRLKLLADARAKMPPAPRG